MYQAVLCGYLFNFQKADKFKTTFGESEEVRNKIQEYNNNVMFNRLNKKDVQSTEFHAPTLPLITSSHIREVLRVPVAYHSQVVDKIITNESGELLTVKETKELVEDIRENTKKLDEIQNYVIEGMNRVPAKYRARLMDKFEKEKIDPLGIKQMIEEFNGDIILEAEAVHIEDTFDEILETPYTEIERYDKSTQFDSNVLDLIKEKCEIPELPKNVWAIEIRDLLQARKVDVAISKLFTSLTDEELNDEDKSLIKTHTITCFDGFMKKIRKEEEEKEGYYDISENRRKKCEFMHEMIMEGVLGRKLRANEIALHLNDDGLDNQRKNLLLGIVVDNEFEKQ